MSQEVNLASAEPLDEHDHVVGLLLDIEVFAFAVPLLGIVVPHAERVDAIAPAELLQLRIPDAIVVHRAMYEYERCTASLLEIREVVAVHVHGLDALRKVPCARGSRCAPAQGCDRADRHELESDSHVPPRFSVAIIKQPYARTPKFPASVRACSPTRCLTFAATGPTAHIRHPSRAGRHFAQNQRTTGTGCISRFSVAPGPCRYYHVTGSDSRPVMLPQDFHPVVRRWWETRFRDAAGAVLPPTEAQVEGWQAIRKGGHALIAAPTGSGKTLAAFLVSIDALLRESL